MYKHDLYSVETPSVLKTARRSQDSPKSKLHPPPTRFAYHQPPISNSIEGHQIILYGFNDGNKEQILQKFHKIGPIEDIKDGQGNSVKIKFRDTASANKAKELHGQVIVENTMIGVKVIGNEGKTNKNTYLGLYESAPISSGYLRKKKHSQQSIWQYILTYVFNFDN